MHRPSAALHGSLGSYIRNALQEGSADAMACLPVPRDQIFPLRSSFCCVVSTTVFSCKNSA
jgi:hypothetical protein